MEYKGERLKGLGDGTIALTWALLVHTASMHHTNAPGAAAHPFALPSPEFCNTTHQQTHAHAHALTASAGWWPWCVVQVKGIMVSLTQCQALTPQDVDLMWGIIEKVCTCTRVCDILIVKRGCALCT